MLDEAPGNADALQMRAVLAVADQNVEQAIADLRRCCGIIPSVSVLSICLAVPMQYVKSMTWPKRRFYVPSN